MERKPVASRRGLGRFALKSHASLAGGTIALSNLNIELDGNVAEGALSYEATGRQLIQGTLAVDTLDLSPYVSSLRLISENPRDWDHSPFTLDWLKRLGGRSAAIGGRRPFRARATRPHRRCRNLHSGQMIVTVGESQSFGGIVTGTVAVTKAGSGAEFKSQMQFADVDMAKCLADLIGRPPPRRHRHACFCGGKQRQ